MERTYLVFLRCGESWQLLGSYEATAVEGAIHQAAMAYEVSLKQDARRDPPTLPLVFAAVAERNWALRTVARKVETTFEIAAPQEVAK